MRIRTLAGFVLGLLCVSTIYAQPTGGLVVAVEPCALGTYGQTLTAETPSYYIARGFCGIPEEAIAVFLNMKAWPSGSLTTGKIYLWPYGNSFPTKSQFNYEFISTWPQSGQALVRLRQGHDYTEYDIVVQATTTVYFAAVVEGYTVPVQ